MPYLLQLNGRGWLCRDELPDELWNNLDLLVRPNTRWNGRNGRILERLIVRVLTAAVVDWPSLQQFCSGHPERLRELREKAFPPLLDHLEAHR